MRNLTQRRKGAKAQRRERRGAETQSRRANRAAIASRIRDAKYVISSEAERRVEKSARKLKATVFQQPHHRHVLSEAIGRVEWIPPLARYARSVGMTWWGLRQQSAAGARAGELGGRNRVADQVTLPFSPAPVGGLCAFAPLRLCVKSGGRAGIPNS